MAVLTAVLGNHRYLFHKDVAARLGLTEDTLHNYRRRGDGPKAFDYDGAWLYELGDLVTWTQGQVNLLQNALDGLEDERQARTHRSTRASRASA